MSTKRLQSNLTPDERRAEIATILARGVQRHKRDRTLAARLSWENPSAASPTGLEVPAKSSLTVHQRAAGERGREFEKRGAQ